MQRRVVRDDRPIRKRDETREWHEGVSGVGDVPDARTGSSGIEVDQRSRSPSDKDGVVGGHVIVADHVVVGGIGVAELPHRSCLSDVAGGGVVQLPEQAHHLDQHVVGPHVWRKWIGADLTLDKGENLAPSIIDAEETRRTVAAPRLKVAQQPLHRRAPRLQRTPDRVPNPNDGRQVPARQRYFSLIHHRWLRLRNGSTGTGNKSSINGKVAGVSIPTAMKIDGSPSTSPSPG